MSQWIDGQKWAQISRAETAEAAAALLRRGVRPGLAVVLVGDHPASQIYVRQKEKAVRAAGLESRVIRLAADAPEESLLDVVTALNVDPKIHGILVQLPLPEHVNADRIVAAIAPEKDVDGFHPVNAGKLSLGLPGLAPCTPLGVMNLLSYEGVNPEGMHAVILGRSNIVGKPMAHLLLHANATVTICHSRTRGLADIVRQADIVVAAIGKPRFLKGDMIRMGAIVIDVGINRVDGAVVGDVDAESVFPVAAKLTPVPRGVGPMTIAMLLQNTLTAAKAMTGFRV